MNVKGILIEGRDGHEYLLAFERRPTDQRMVPTLSRRRPDGAFDLLEDTREASKVTRTQLGSTGPRLIGPGWGKELYLWRALEEALKAFPPPPTWPTWTSST